MTRSPLANCSVTSQRQIVASLLSREQRRHADVLRAPNFAEQRHGIALFVDVSGFTALTESFNEHGRSGSERLSILIRKTFERIITCAEEAGGDVIAFAGDAIWATWSIPTAEGSRDPILCREVAQRAVAAAKAIQARFQSDAPSEDANIRIRIALGAGALRFSSYCVGENRYDFLAAGDAIVDAGSAERRARPGDVVLTSAVKQMLGDSIGGEWLGPDVMRVIDVVEGPMSPSRSNTEPAEPFDEAIARGYLPRFLVESIEQKLFDWIAEFRTVSVLFIRLRAFGSEAPPEEEHLCAALIAIQTILRRLNGERYQLLMDEKGVTCVVAFGLPFSVTEDCASRAVRAALDVEMRLNELSIEVTIGCTTGAVFCNVTGTESRRAYVMTGSTLNLAARLMQSGDRGVLCDHNTRAASTGHAGLAFEALAPRLVPGRANAVLVYRPSLRVHSTLPLHNQRGLRPLIGRNQERRLLASTLSAFVASGEGAVVTVEGEAGIGKTSLVSHFADSLAGFGVEQFQVAGQSHESAATYQGVGPIFKRLLSLPRVPTSVEDQIALLEARLDDPGLVPYLPLLNQDLRFPIQESEATLALTDEGRAHRYRELYLSLFNHFAREKRTVILVEDAHWLDGASFSFLHVAAKAIGQLLVVIATRPTDGDRDTCFQQIVRLPHCRRLTLTPLAHEEVLALIRERLQVDSVPSQIMRLVDTRASGNPLFSLELVYALRDQDLIAVDGTRCAALDGNVSLAFDESMLARGLPSTLQGVVSSRFDRLDLDHQLVLKVASVTARAFSEALLHPLEPLRPLQGRLRPILSRLVELEFLRVTSLEPTTEYTMSHALLGEAIYGSIPFEQRRILHNAVAAWLEQQPGQDDPVELAHHYHRGGQLDRALTCFETAGAEAFRIHSFGDSARSYVRALRVFDEKHGSEGEAPLSRRRGMLELALGRAHVCWGKYNQAVEPIEAGLRRLDEKIPRTALATAVFIFWELFVQIWFRLWSPTPTRTDAKRELWLAKARAYEGLTESYFNLGKSIPCLYCALVSLNCAERAGASAELARGYSSFGAILGFVPMTSAARSYCRRARTVADAVQDRGAEAWVSVATGVLEAGLGNWNVATERFEETARLGRLIGDDRRLDDGTENQCAVHYLQGRFRDGLTAAETLLASARKRDDLTMHSSALRSLAYGRIWLSELDEATRRIDDLQQLRNDEPSERVGLPHVDVYPLKALLAFRRGSVDTALEAAEAGLRAITAASPMFYVVLFEYAALAEVFLGLGERAVTLRLEQGSRVVSQLRSFARVFPVARPVSAFFDGQLAHHRGRKKLAYRRYLMATELANNQCLPYWEALAHARLATLPDLSPSRRANHESRAVELLTRLGETHVLSTLKPARSSAASSHLECMN